MNVSIKPEEAEGRTSLAYQDESDDGQSLLSNDGRDVTRVEMPNPRENPVSWKKTPWVRALAALGLRRGIDDLPYYKLQERSRTAHSKPRSRRCMGSCLRYFIAYVPSLDTYPTIANDQL